MDNNKLHATNEKAGNDIEQTHEQNHEKNEYKLLCYSYA